MNIRKHIFYHNTHPFRKGILFFIMCIVLVSLSSIQFMASDKPQVDTDYYIVMDADTGEIILGKNIDAQCYPASVTKLMTALIVTENCDLGGTLTVSQDAPKSVTYGDANAAIKAGEVFTVEDALNILLIKSANDMAYALAEYTAGTVANFTDMMNKKAEELGCTGTHFANASGLSNSNHYTTAHDMALICRAVIDNPDIMGALSFYGTYSVAPTNKTSETRYYRQHHQLLKNRDHYYPYYIGGKTGYTDASGYTLASMAEKDGLRLICIIFNSTDDQRYLDTISLFEYVYNTYHKVYIAQNENIFSSNSNGFMTDFGIEGNAISNTNGFKVIIPEDDYLLLPDSCEFDDLSRYVIYEDDGTIKIYYNSGDTTVGTTTLEFLHGNNSNISSRYLPYRQSDNISIDIRDHVSGSRYIAINIWVLMAVIVLLIILIILIIIKIKHDSNPLFSHKKRKLHF